MNKYDHCLFNTFQVQNCHFCLQSYWEPSNALLTSYKIAPMIFSLSTDLLLTQDENGVVFKMTYFSEPMQLPFTTNLFLNITDQFTKFSYNFSNF